MTKEVKDQVLKKWQQALRMGTDLDTWGQPVEAVQHYQALVKELQNACMDGTEVVLTNDEKKIVRKLVTCLELRSRGLQIPGCMIPISLIDMKNLQEKFLSILSGRPNQFPVDINAALAYTNSQDGRVSEIVYSEGGPPVVDDEQDPMEKKARGSLLPRPAPLEGRTVVTITMEKLGVKDAEQLINTHLVIYVKDKNGVNLTAAQTTPFITCKSDCYILINTPFYVQRHLEALPNDVAIIFELCHYKPQKDKMSTRCWAFLERDELKEGSCCIELYKKPMDPKRKKLSLLTKKPLYLHLDISLN